MESDEGPVVEGTVFGVEVGSYGFVGEGAAALAFGVEMRDGAFLNPGLVGFRLFDGLRIVIFVGGLFFDLLQSTRFGIDCRRVSRCYLLNVCHTYKHLVSDREDLVFLLSDSSCAQPTHVLVAQLREPVVQLRPRPSPERVHFAAVDFA